MLTDLKNNQTINPPAAKAKQINVRLTAEQERLLRQHCVRARISLQALVVDALARTVAGFEAN